MRNPSRHWVRVTVLMMTCLAVSCAKAQRAEPDRSFEVARRAMVDIQLAGRDIDDARVLEAMRLVPRHHFVPEALQRFAYSDTALPIGLDQTISQPYIVALMTQLAEPGPGDRVLEIGTGSGYQAAVLAGLARRVYTIEILPELAERAGKTLGELGYDNVTVRAGDGYAGWSEHAPFDIVVVTAAAPRLPQPLVEQLAEGGRLVIPMGRPGVEQMLARYRKRDGRLEREDLLPVIFVPMTGRVEKPE